MIKLVAAAALTLFAAGSAQAAVSFTSTPFYTGTPAGQTLVEDFDSPIAAGYTFTFTNGAGVEDHSIANYAAAPAGDTTQYAVVPTGGHAYLDSSQPFYSASVYMGSIDSYNDIAFLDNNVVVADYSGSQLVANPNGDQTSGLTNRTFDFDFGGQAVDEIAFGSSGYSFEVDNIAVSAAPEPAAWLLMIAGVGAIGYAFRQAKRRHGFTFVRALTA